MRPSPTFFMIPAVVVLVLVTSLFVGCSRPSDGGFRERDRQLQSEFEQERARYTQKLMSREQYAQDLRRLREQELKLYGDVQQHTFRDITESNYWHRGRLKFPSRIEQELAALSTPTTR